MKLYQLHLFEEHCKDCQKQLAIDDIKHMSVKTGGAYCQSCSMKNKKESERQDAEEQNVQKRQEAMGKNLFNVSQQMPNRGHDQKLGSPGWISGDPSPGRGGF